jgi:hypothetical protein
VVPNKVAGLSLYRAYLVIYAADNMQPSSDRHDRPPTVDDSRQTVGDRGPTVEAHHTTVRRVPVPEAAQILGVTPDAVRSRLRRGKLRKDTSADGTILVVLDFEATDGHDSHDRHGDGHSGSHARHGARSDGQPTVTPLVEALQSQVEHLRRQLDEANRANAEHRRLLAAALERIPAIEPPEEAPPEPREEPETASPEMEGVEVPIAERKPQRSFWQKLFGT